MICTTFRSGCWLKKSKQTSNTEFGIRCSVQMTWTRHWICKVEYYKKKNYCFLVLVFGFVCNFFLHQGRHDQKFPNISKIRALYLICIQICAVKRAFLIFYYLLSKKTPILCQVLIIYPKGSYANFFNQIFNDFVFSSNCQ